jgi:putative endopeptidase
MDRPRVVAFRRMNRLFSSIAVLGLVNACQSKPAESPRPAPLPGPTTAPIAAPAPAPKPELGSFGIDLSNRDTSAKPGNDFYRYVNGHWLDTYQLKPDEMRFGAFIALSYRAEDQVKAILEEISSKPSATGSPEQQIADYYRSFMDEPMLRTRGISALKPDLDYIAGLKTHKDLVDAFGRSRLMQTNAPFVSWVEPDRRDSDKTQLNVMHSGLGLPDRSYYFEETFKPVLAAYREHIATMLGFTGLPRDAAKKAAESIVELETKIAKVHWTPTELRDVDKTNNTVGVEAFEKQFAGYPWRQHFKAGGLDLARVKDLNVYTPSAFAPLSKLVRDTPLATWRHYLAYHLITQHAELLGDEIDNANFAFRGRVLSGQPEQRERWKRALNLVGDIHALGEAIGKLYVERHYPPDAAAKMTDLVANLRAAFEERLKALDWMGPETKKQALVKLATFNPKIGGPKKWRDFSSIKIVSGELLQNYKAVAKYWYDDELSRLGKPTDKDEWQMTSQTINAYYNPAFNEVVFPAAILQPPFFDPNADPAVNYGAIGAVIGHELGHGFDDQGSKSDEKGVQRNWWTEKDRMNFEARTKLLVQQYAKFEPLKGQPVNGELTLGENIGDLGGVSIALHAYQRSLGGKPAPVIDGYSGEQRFFLSWAQVWLSKQRDEYTLRALKTDPHSPPKFRVNGVVANVDAWYDAFGVQPGDPMYVPPKERVQIW